MQSMRIPQDIANLLATAIRDIIWFKSNIKAFLKECGVPEIIIIEVEGLQKTQATIPTILNVLDRLGSFGDEGKKPQQEMLTKIYYWKDLHSIPEDRKDKARISLKEFRRGYDKYDFQRKQQEKQEREVHQDRVDRGSIRDLDHIKLQNFRDEFDKISLISNRQTRGNKFEKLMNAIFDYYCEEQRGGFKREGEQIDGLFYFDKHWYLVEIRWQEQQANAADISVLRDRAKNSYGGDTKALFISFNGFTPECLKSLTGNADERVVLMDGYDLRVVLDCKIGFDSLLAAKQRDIVQYKRPYISAKDILNR